jgi:hypothetical protein
MVTDRIVKWLAITAVVFGILTVVSGGRALFGAPDVREALGYTVPFVLWFNFLAGFAYILTGAGLLTQARWAAPAAIFLAVTTVLIFAALGAHIATGGSYEMRTVVAMTMRSAFWIAVAVFSAMNKKPF